MMRNSETAKKWKGSQPKWHKIVVMSMRFRVTEQGKQSIGIVLIKMYAL